MEYDGSLKTKLALDISLDFEDMQPVVCNINKMKINR